MDSYASYLKRACLLHDTSYESQKGELKQHGIQMLVLQTVCRWRKRRLAQHAASNTGRNVEFLWVLLTVEVMFHICTYHALDRAKFPQIRKFGSEYPAYETSLPLQ